jgi:arginase
VHAGCRDRDAYLAEASGVIAQVIPASRIRRTGAAGTAASVLATVDRDELDGYWLHLDVDILDPDGSYAGLLTEILATGLGSLSQER